ncbi:MAG: endopeptidase La [FCB group bacterium]|nr:endopeptidase La [FCB group bacterium]
MPILPVKGIVVFPFLVVPLIITEKKQTRLIDEALMQGRTIGIFCTRDADVHSPGFEDIYPTGTAGNILKMLRFPDGSVRFLVQGLARIRIKKKLGTEPYMMAAVEEVKERLISSVKAEALQRNLIDQLKTLTDLAPYLSEEFYISAINQDTPGQLTDLVASNMNLTIEEKQHLIAEPNITRRTEILLAHINREKEVLELSKKIQAEAANELGKMQREYILREQIKAIHRELGDGEIRPEMMELKNRIEEAGMTEQALQAAEKELERLTEMNPSSAEYTVSRTYLDWLVSVPWKKSTDDVIDIRKAKKVLDEDHYNLEKVKERIIEFLAVRRLNPDIKGPILCFVGPPGVGKTSLGRSIARAMGREFYRLSLGGLRDEAEIRGHRRTYIGAMPGRIIQGLKRVEANNPVFMLDEIDKLGSDFRGDPSSALLEVLDPEQNNTFSDHYLEVDFDLSRVMFITTANILDPIPAVLRDRMEVIRLPGYTDLEKAQIFNRHLLPKQMTNHGLTSKHLAFRKDAIEMIIDKYTREAGLRNLERELANVCRKVAARIAGGGRKKADIGAKNLPKYLGPPRFTAEARFSRDRIGEVAALAWTAYGGEVLKVEATAMPGKKVLTLTGQLGSVMKESVQAAYSFVRTMSDKLDISPAYFDSHEIHVHVPSGATPKDGPSAGVAMAVTLASLAAGRAVKDKLAMTGEITLRGQVLPIGGMKEKMLAAYRYGIKTVLLPKANKKDLVEIPPEIKKALTFKFLDNASEFIKFALEPKKKA